MVCIAVAAQGAASSSACKPDSRDFASDFFPPRPRGILIATRKLHMDIVSSHRIGSLSSIEERAQPLTAGLVLVLFEGPGVGSGVLSLDLFGLGS